MNSRALLLAAGLFVAPLPVLAAASVDLRVPLIRASTPPALEPALDDPRWREVPLFSDFIDLGTKAPAVQQTRVRVLYDDRAIYVAFEADQTVPLQATQTTNDVGFGVDDFVGIGIDAGGNGERLYYFYVTPRGTRYAAASESTRYRPVWSAAAAPTARGWNAVLAIPYTTMRLAGDGAQRWRLNFVRNIGATAEHQTWAFNGLMSYQTIPNWPDLVREWRYWPTVTQVTLRGAVPRPKPKAEIYGLQSLGNDRDRFTLPNGTLVQRAPRTAGVDLSIPLDSTIGFVGAFSPDFSNVEVDQQTIAPQQFRRNLTEYRPFFAQGAPFVNARVPGFEFNFPLDTLFYSPAIGPFDRGLKLVGTHGSDSFGALEVRGSDPATSAPFDDMAFGFRHRRPSNTLLTWFDGAIVNHGTTNDRSWEAGASGRSLASGLVYAINHGQETGSLVTDPSRAQRSEAFIDLQKPGFEGALAWVDVGPQWSPVDGFTNIADIRGPNLMLDFNRAFGAGSFKNAELFLYADRWLDRQGNVHAADADAFLILRMRSPLALYGNVQTGTLRTYEGDFFSGDPHGYRSGVAQPFKTKSIGVGYGEGTPRSIRIDEQFGPFGTFFLNQLTTTLTAAFGRAGVAVDYAGTVERTPGLPLDGQWLRRFTFSMPFGEAATATLQYRVVSGRGGNAVPGRNLAGGLRYRLRNGSELFVNYGTPNATTTLDRLVVKLLVRLNGGV